MAHKTKINGTTYSIKGGKTKVNGTAYSIKKGMTKVNGTGYAISFIKTLHMYNWTSSYPYTGQLDCLSVQLNGKALTSAADRTINDGDELRILFKYKSNTYAGYSYVNINGVRYDAKSRNNWCTATLTVKGNIDLKVLERVSCYGVAELVGDVVVVSVI